MGRRTSARKFFFGPMSDSEDSVLDLRSNSLHSTIRTERPSLTLRDSILRVMFNPREQARLIPRSRGRSNVRSTKLPAFTEYIFFLICDLPWLQLFILTTGMLLFFILFFAIVFYFVGGVAQKDMEEEHASLWTCLCFSFQTMDQIGYGLFSPSSFPCDIAMTFTSLCANFFWKFSAGIIFIKLSLPKKLKYLNRFSTVAVKNRNQLTFQEEDGYQRGVDSLTFRIAGTFSSSSICDSQFHLVYFRHKPDGQGYLNYEFHECNYEINRQQERNRDVNFSAPVLGLPWLVTHPIDKYSPLYGLSLQQMEKENGELIGILVGIDEISSLIYQTRWSYKASEILEGREFVPCVKRDREKGFFLVDFNRLSKTRVILPDLPLKSKRKSKFKRVHRRIQKRLASTTTKIKRTLSRSLTATRMHMPNMSPRRLSESSLRSHRSSFSCGSSPAHGLEDIFVDLRRMALLGKRGNDIRSPRASLLSHASRTSYTYPIASDNRSESNQSTNESNFCPSKSPISRRANSEFGLGLHKRAAISQTEYSNEECF